jgi:hypothetical protein
MISTFDELRDLAEHIKDGSYLSTYPLREQQLAEFKACKDNAAREAFKSAFWDDYKGPSFMHCLALDAAALRGLRQWKNGLTTVAFENLDPQTGCAPIHFAVLARNRSALQFFLERSLSRDQKVLDMTAFDLAIALGHLECIEMCMTRNDMKWDYVFDNAFRAPSVDAFHLLVASQHSNTCIHTDMLAQALRLGRIDVLDEVWDARRRGARFNDTLDFAKLRASCPKAHQAAFNEWYRARFEEKQVDTVILHKANAEPEAVRKRVVEFMDQQARNISTKRPSVHRVIGLEDSARTAFTIATSSEAVPCVFRASSGDERACEALTMANPPWPCNITFGDVANRAKRGDTMHLQILHRGALYSSENPGHADVVIQTTLANDSEIKRRFANGELMSTQEREIKGIPTFGDNCVVVSPADSNPVSSVKTFLHVEKE